MSDLTFTDPTSSVLASAVSVREKLTRDQFISALQNGRTDFRGVDFSGQNLSGLDVRSILPDPNLPRLNFSGADLRRANLKCTNLEGVNLMSAHLEDTNLEGAHFIDVDLRYAHLARANLKDANLESADLRRANLEYTDLEGAILTGAILTEEDFEKLKSNTTINEEQLKTVSVMENDNIANKQPCIIR